MSTSRNQQIQQLEQDWKTNPRWEVLLALTAQMMWLIYAVR